MKNIIKECLKEHVTTLLICILTTFNIFMVFYILIIRNCSDCTSEAPTTEPETVTEIETTTEAPAATLSPFEEVITTMEEWYVGKPEFTPIDCSLDDDIQEFIFYLSMGYDIDFYFIMAVIEHESRYVVDAVSKTGDYGLMQINEQNHEWLSEALGLTDITDPYQNVMAGTYKLYLLIQKHGSYEMALMAYNMGSSGASKLWAEGIYKTNYSKEIMARMEEMRGGE